MSREMREGILSIVSRNIISRRVETPPKLRKRDEIMQISGLLSAQEVPSINLDSFEEYWVIRVAVSFR